MSGSTSLRISSHFLTTFITTFYFITGTGGQGFSYNDIPATSTFLYNPYGLWLDEGQGRLYVVDTLNQYVRFVDLSSGIMRAFIGTGEYCKSTMS